MTPIGFDFETMLIRPGLQCPPPVCATVSDGRVDEIWTSDDWSAFADRVRGVLTGPEGFVGHNVCQFDLPVALAWLDCTYEVFAALASGRVWDTMWIERLAIIRRVSRSSAYALTLADVCRAHGVKPPAKDDGTQTSFEPLFGRPRSEYSDRQIEYAIEDAHAVREVFERQSRWFETGALDPADLHVAQRKQFALALTRSWGMRTDPARTDALEVAVREHVGELREAALAMTVDVCDQAWDMLLPAADPRFAKIRKYVNREREIARRVGAAHRPLPIVRADGSKDSYALQMLVTEAYGGAPPWTRPPRQKPGAAPREREFVPSVSTARATLEESEDVALTKFAEYGEWSAVQNKDLDLLKAGAITPIHTSFGMADTTRATSFAPNVQNQRRDRPGRPSIRECFVARPGYVLIAIDHCGLELSTLAQCCVSLLGRRHMADRINAGEDLHSHLGAAIFRTSYADFLAQLEWPGRSDTSETPLSADWGQALFEKVVTSAVPSLEPWRRTTLWEDRCKVEPGKPLPTLDALIRAAAKNARNNGKVVNFGCPGGMAWKTLKLYAKQNYGITLTDEQARSLVALWRETNPDGAAFLEYVHSLQNDSGLFDVRIPGTNLVRRNCTYCAACNTHFQGLGAVLEGWIAWLFAREIYEGVTPDGKPSPMRWAHPWNFVHDEHIFEVQEEARTEVAGRMTEIMRAGARKYLTDVKCESELVCMRRWSKNAKSKIVDGELTIWDSAA